MADQQHSTKPSQDNIDLIHLRSLHLVSKYSCLYTSALINIQKKKNVDLNKAAKLEKDKIKEKFSAECKRDCEIIASGISDLNKELASISEKLLKGDEIKSSEPTDKANAFLITECCHNYLNSMEPLIRMKTKGWTEVISPEELQECHEQSVILADPESRSRSKSVKEALTKELDLLLEAFQIKDMLNQNLYKPIYPGDVPTAAIGIDLGGTTSCVAVYLNGKAHVCPNIHGNWDLSTPSYVTIPTISDEFILFGEDAMNEDVQYAFYDLIHIMGRRMNDPFIQDNLSRWPFKLQGDNLDLPMLKLRDGFYYPWQILVRLVRHLIEVGESHFCGTTPGIVVTVPNHCKEQEANIELCLDMLNLNRFAYTIPRYEAVAATLKLDLKAFMNFSKLVVVFDLTSRFLEVSVLRIKPNVQELLGWKGDMNLGGNTFTRNVMARCAQQFQKLHEINLLDYEENVKGRSGNLWNECERAKFVLTEKRSTAVNITDANKLHNLKVRLTREMFEEINRQKFQKTIDILDEALKISKTERQTIDEIMLVGASTKIPKVKELLTLYFQGKVHFNQKIDPEHIIACGAAEEAAMSNGLFNKTADAVAKRNNQDREKVLEKLTFERVEVNDQGKKVSAMLVKG